MGTERYADKGRDYPVLTNDKGEKLCRWCQGVLAGRRRAYCSDKCSEEVAIRCGENLLWHVEQRDHGVCFHCNMDMIRERSELMGRIDAINRALWNGPRIEMRGGAPNIDDRINNRAIKKQRGELEAEEIAIERKIYNEYLITNTTMSWWAAHHVIAVKDGGGGCGLDNIITLCVKCHKDFHAGRIELKGRCSVA